MGDFDRFLDNLWDIHGSTPQIVANNFNEGLSLLRNSNDAYGLAFLVCHVFGEHLKQWENGLQAIETIEYFNKQFMEPISFQPLILSLKLCSMVIPISEIESSETLSIPEKIKVLSISSSALLDTNIECSKTYFRLALSLKEQDTESTFISRSIATMSNNLASSLEEKSILSLEEQEFMISAAIVARDSWKIAGGALEACRAETLLARVYFKINDYPKAFHHGEVALQHAQETSSALPMDYFQIYSFLTLSLFKADPPITPSPPLSLSECHSLSHRYYSSMLPQLQSTFLALFQSLPPSPP